MDAPRVAVSPPADWVAIEIERPRIAQSAGAAFTDWVALRGAGNDAVLVKGCVATSIPGWVEDMRPAVEGRTVALAGAAAAKVTGAPIDARPSEGGLLDLRAASDLGGPVLGHARTFVGFDASRVFTCFAACVSPHRSSEADPSGPRERLCDHAVDASRLEGSLPPPAPGIALRGATWAVHHPHPAATGALVLLTFAGILAVALRRRPRSRAR